MDKILVSAREIIRKKKIPLKKLHEVTGYSLCHLSSVINELKSCSPQFYRLISLALVTIVGEDTDNIQTALEDLWTPSLSLASQL